MQFMQRTSDAALTTLLPMAQLSYLLSLSPGPEGVDMPGVGRGDLTEIGGFVKPARGPKGEFPAPQFTAYRLHIVSRSIYFPPLPLRHLRPYALIVDCRSCSEQLRAGPSWARTIAAEGF